MNRENKRKLYEKGYYKTQIKTALPAKYAADLLCHREQGAITAITARIA